MSEFPAGLLAAIPAGGVAKARQWWDSLSEPERLQIADLWDQRLEVQFFEPQADDAGQVDPWDKVPKVVGGRFVPHDDAWGLDDWGPGYFEHLLQHPELVIVWEPVMRTFHIGCTQHAAARACLKSRHVPADFVCPAGSKSCFLEPLRGGELKNADRRSPSSPYRDSPSDRTRRQSM